MSEVRFDTARWFRMAASFSTGSVALLFGSTVLGSYLSGADPMISEMLRRGGIYWLVWMLFTPAVVATAWKFPLAGARKLRSVPTHAVVSTGLALLFAPAFLWFKEVVPAAQEIDDSAAATWGAYIGFGFPVNLFFYWSFVGGATAIESSRELQVRRLQSARIEAQLAHARLVALQSQLHPHFLFNTLNSISSLVRTGDEKRAIRMIARLSDLLRRMLHTREEPVVALQEELDVLEDYLGIEQERLGERLCVDIDVAPEAASVPVPALLLQPIAENAIKHGISPIERPCTLSIRGRVAGESLELEVCNDGVPAGELAEPGVGLTNTRSRLAELYGDAFELTLDSRGATGARVALRLPLHSSIGAVA